MSTLPSSFLDDVFTISIWAGTTGAPGIPQSCSFWPGVEIAGNRQPRPHLRYWPRHPCTATEDRRQSYRYECLSGRRWRANDRGSNAASCTFDLNAMSCRAIAGAIERVVIVLDLTGIQTWFLFAYSEVTGHPPLSSPPGARGFPSDPRPSRWEQGSSPVR